MSIIEKFGITKNEFTSIWSILLDWGKPFDMFDNMWFGYSQLKDDTSVEIYKLKKLMRYMRKKNIVFYGPTFDSECMLCGSGYFIHPVYLEKTAKDIMDIL